MPFRSCSELFEPEGDTEDWLGDEQPNRNFRAVRLLEAQGFVTTATLPARPAVQLRIDEQASEESFAEPQRTVSLSVIQGNPLRLSTKMSRQGKLVMVQEPVKENWVKPEEMDNEIESLRLKCQRVNKFKHDYTTQYRKLMQISSVIKPHADKDKPKKKSKPVVRGRGKGKQKTILPLAPA